MTAELTRPVELTRQQVRLRMCPACLMDMCETCFEGTCACACQDWPPTVIRDPARCGRCGYARTALGHRVACEPAETRRARLEEATAEYFAPRRRR